MSEQDKSLAQKPSDTNDNNTSDEYSAHKDDDNSDTVSDTSSAEKSDDNLDNENAEIASIQDQYEYDSIENAKYSNSEDISDNKADNNTDNKTAEHNVNSDAKDSTKPKRKVIPGSKSIQKKEDTSPSSTEEIDPDLPHAKPMTLMQHLGELRNILVRSSIAIALAFVVCYSFASIIFAELIRPLTKVLPENSKLIFTSLPEAFFLELQIGFVAAIFLSSPFLFYQIWSFIAPGLYDEEKKYAIPIAIISAFFFICGAAFCYFVVFPFSFQYFMSFATEDIIPMPSISQYFGFTLKILVAFGLIFEMPLFTFFLSRMGIVTATAMRNVRKYSVLAIFIIAAILTPPDVISQLLMAIPMILLYELSIYIAVIFGRKPKVKKDEDEKDTESHKKDTDDDKKNADDAKKNADDDKKDTDTHENDTDIVTK